MDKNEYVDQLKYVLEDISENINDALKAYFENGVFADFTNYVTPLLEMDGWSQMSFEIASCIPTWEFIAEELMDDAIVGEDGEWEFSGKYIPIFFMGEGVLVVNNESELLEVGCFAEEGFDSEDENYNEGVFNLNKSLDAFLKSLIPRSEANYEEIFELHR